MKHTVKSILDKVKANARTYHNITSEQDIANFKKYYRYLKAHQDEEVSPLAMKAALSDLENAKYMEFVRKFKAMQIVANGIMKKRFDAERLTNSTKNTVYKFRAECDSDVFRFFKKMNGKAKIITSVTPSMKLPDIEVTFRSDLSKSEIMKAMAKIPDGHVMAETVERFEDYTGIRRSY